MLLKELREFYKGSIILYKKALDRIVDPIARITAIIVHMTILAVVIFTIFSFIYTIIDLFFI